MPDLTSRWSSEGRPLGRTDLVLEDERSNTVVILDVICRCDDITVKRGTQTVAVIARLEFTQWLWNGGDLLADDLALSVEGETLFAVLNGDRQYVVMSGSRKKLSDLLANSG